MDTTNFAPAILALATLLTAIGALVTTLRTHAKVTTVSDNVARVESNTNSKMDEMLRIAKIASRAEGVLAEKTRQEGIPPSDGAAAPLVKGI